MNNKTLSILAVVPFFIAIMSGLFGFDTDGLTLFLGLWMFITLPWITIRLYKTPDNN